MSRILVVDDAAVDRRLVGGLVEKAGRYEIEYAENGKQALQQMHQNPPDLVVTDLQMPEMDGLELVGQIRLRFPHIPVILVTAHGSESLAVEALEQGAASYVPKSQVSQEIVDTIDQVLGISRSDRSYERLMSSIISSEFSFRLDNDPALIDPLVDFVQQMVSSMQICDTTERVRMGVALEEALLNALYRGNLEIGAEQLEDDRVKLMSGGSGESLVEERRNAAPYRDRKTLVHVFVSTDKVTIVIKDDGQGFDTQTQLRDDPEALTSQGGRGLILMRTFMDEVQFNGQGNEVTLVKRRRSQAEPVGAQ